MDAFTTNDLKPLLQPREGPCLSIYLPTDRGLADKNAVRWKNQLHAAERHLKEAGIEASVYGKWLAPAWKLQGDRDFWRFQSDGFAWFQSGDFTRFYRQPIPFEAHVACGPHFRVTPMLEALGENGGFFVLAISQNQVRLLHGTRFGLENVDLKNVPRSLAEALRFDDRQEAIDFHGLRPGNNAGWGSVFYGNGGGFDEHKTDLLRYFQLVDRGLHEFLRNEKAPLFLAAVEYLWPIYHEANTYKYLQNVGLPGNPDHRPVEKMHEDVWKLAGPLFRQPRLTAMANYAKIAGTGRTVEGLEDLLLAAHQGLVDTLFFDRSAEWYGAFDEITGSQTRSNPQPSTEEDMVNLAAVYTLRHGGKVWPCPAGEAPRALPLAAILRAPLEVMRPEPALV
jgi:hypothetical protein